VLPEPLVQPLPGQLVAGRAQHLEDLRRGNGSVALPDAIARKFPSAPREWAWQWVFEARTWWFLPPMSRIRLGLRRP
jgi:hypothetical protein